MQRKAMGIDLVELAKIMVPAALTMYGTHQYDVSSYEGKSEALGTVIELYTEKLIECQTAGVDNG